MQQNNIDQLAIELKYQGISYGKISHELKGEFSANTLRKYFAKGGRLYHLYMQYAESQSATRRRYASLMLQSASQTAVKALLGVLDKAMKDGDSHLILKASQIVLDRAGVPAAKRIEFEQETLKDDDQDLSIEAVRDRLRRDGIDPDSIKFIDPSPPRTRGTLPDF